MVQSPHPQAKGSLSIWREETSCLGVAGPVGGSKEALPKQLASREGQTVPLPHRAPYTQPPSPGELGRGSYLSDEDSAHLLVIPTEGGEELMVSGGETALIVRAAAWGAGEGHEGSNTYKHWPQQPPTQSCCLSNWLSGSAETFLSSPILRSCTPSSVLSPSCFSSFLF